MGDQRRPRLHFWVDVMFGTIYIHTNKRDGKCYVGQSRNPHKRWRSKLSAYLNNPHFYNALKRDGWDGFDHQIVFQAECTQEQLDQLERLWIVFLNTLNPAFGYNLRAGGEVPTFSDETRKKMSKAARTHTGKANNFFGKTHSTEAREAISKFRKANASRIWTVERRAALGETIRRIRAERHWSSGRKKKLTDS